MRLPKKDQKGFTLVELLIVLAILAVLAAVVIPNVTGMFGRGAEQAYDTDKKTIQTAASTFYFDIHSGDAGTDWDDDGDPGHKWPTASGGLPTTTYAGGATAPTDAEGIIWMGLLVLEPGTGTVGASTDFPAVVAPLADEDGPYLNEFPSSCHPLNTYKDATDSETEGTYIWVLSSTGQVLSFYFDSSVGTAGEWVEGFGDTYP